MTTQAERSSVANYGCTKYNFTLNELGNFSNLKTFFLKEKKMKEILWLAFGNPDQKRRSGSGLIFSVNLISSRTQRALSRLITSLENG